jgi:hypothetical protein
METEAREKAAQMRISNFYKTGTGKMNPETFYFTVYSKIHLVGGFCDSFVLSTE